MSYFKEFVFKYNNGTIADDVTWRAYDIEAMARPSHAQAALNLVNFGKGKRGDHAYSHVAAWFNLGSAQRAEHLLGLWYVWRAIALGDRKWAVLRKAAGSSDPACP